MRKYCQGIRQKTDIWQVESILEPVFEKQVRNDLGRIPVPALSVYLCI